MHWAVGETLLWKALSDPGVEPGSSLLWGWGVNHNAAVVWTVDAISACAFATEWWAFFSIVYYSFNKRSSQQWRDVINQAQNRFINNTKSEQAFIKLNISFSLRDKNKSSKIKMLVHKHAHAHSQQTHTHTKPERVKHIKTIGLVLSLSPSSLYHSPSPSVPSQLITLSADDRRYSSLIPLHYATMWNLRPASCIQK